MTQTPDPNQPITPHIPPAPLDYQPPQRPPSKNRWWMVLLRILAGIAGGLASGAFGFWIAALTNQPIFILIPPTLLFGVLLFVSIKYRRFGYVTGIILAPFLAAAALFILLLIICGGGKWSP